MSCVKEMALKIGAFLHENSCKYLTIRILIIICSLVLFAYEIVLTLFSHNNHEDYRINAGHYLVRQPEKQFRGLQHMESCCQRFLYLDEDDVNAINHPNVYLDLMIFGILIAGSIIGSIWAMFVSLFGRYQLTVAVTFSGMMVGQFSLQKAVVKYGDECIECSRLHWLLVKPFFYPFLGVFIFIMSTILLIVFMNCKKSLFKNKLAFIIWMIMALFVFFIWMVTNILVILSSTLGFVLIINTVMDLLVLSETYYEYTLMKKKKPKTCQQRVASLFDFGNKNKKPKDAEQKPQHQIDDKIDEKVDDKADKADE